MIRFSPISADVTAPTPFEARYDTSEVAGLKRQIAEQAIEIAALKRELAARPLPETVTRVTPGNESNATQGNTGNTGNARLTPAEKQRRYRERKAARVA